MEDIGVPSVKSMRQVVGIALKKAGYPYRLVDFIPYGYDERQFCSPAFNLAMGNLTRSQFGESTGRRIDRRDVYQSTQ